MYFLNKILFVASFALVATSSSFAKSSNAETSDTTLELYKTHCASCHNEHRLGGMGPALLPENLKRLRKPAAVKVIKNGRAATQMPAFKDKLTDKQVQSLVDYVYTPLKETPAWGLDMIKASHIIHNKESDLSNKPVFEVEDPLNLFLVVELGDHHVTLLDGDKL